MPDPGYQRESATTLWSTRTASTFERPSGWRCGVRSYSKVEYPYGREPSSTPLIQTVLSRYTPSNRMETLRPRMEAESGNVFRYQATPPGRKPVPLAFFGLCGLSIDQSW